MALLLVLPSPSDVLMLGSLGFAAIFRGEGSGTAGDIGIAVYFVFPPHKLITFFTALGLEGMGETTKAVPQLFQSSSVTKIVFFSR
jgi:hypothetical protein